jgi:hypothetical protein
MSSVSGYQGRWYALSEITDQYSRRIALAKQYYSYEKKQRELEKKKKKELKRQKKQEKNNSSDEPAIPTTED